MFDENVISEEQIEKFLNGRDPLEKIVDIECSYNDTEASIIFLNKEGVKILKRESFKPFLWAKNNGAKRLFLKEKNGRQDRELLKKKMERYGIKATKLNIYTENGETTTRLEEGYRTLFTATKPMSYSTFLKFFKEGGVDVYDDTKDFLCVSPVEQHMMRTGKRFFKSYDFYDDLLRLSFDLETGGLDPEIHRISKIGIRTNKNFEKILSITGDTEEEKNISELKSIDDFFKTLSEIKPDIIIGHNSENFDWNFIIVRCMVLGTTVDEISSKYFRQSLYKSKKKTVLKLGGEIEYFNKTNLWGYSIIDSLHAVRRAQAIDSDMKKADLKYVTKYSKLNKPNRVYVSGDKIEKIGKDKINNYAFNNKDGSWYLIDDKHSLREGYEIVKGRDIIQRYLQDDLYETDKVELRYNEANFLLGKILPTTFSRVCTMGTAGVWKLLMLAWSFENNLAIPNFTDSRKFTGGLSRLLKVGYVSKVVKLDFNSLYPSIVITWKIKPKHDITNVMLMMLNYMLTKREEFKGLKENANEHVNELKSSLESIINDIEKEPILIELNKWESVKNSNDKKQLPLKVCANGFFGSFGAPNIFPWGDVALAEKTTCVGRQSLRLMIKWFTDKGYTPIVGDSFSSDTPVYIKYNDNDMIDITPISEIINADEIKKDVLGREYDYSKKNFKVLCRSGWYDVSYIYRHKTDKNIHNIKFEGGEIDVTSDHSLFDKDKKKIDCSNINQNTELETYELKIETKRLNTMSINEAYELGLSISSDSNIQRIPIEILNSNKMIKFSFIRGYLSNGNNNEQNRSKAFKAGLNFINNELDNDINE